MAVKTAKDLTQDELEEIFQSDEEGWEIEKGGETQEDFPPAWDFEANKVIMGVYKKRKPDTGPNKSMWYEVETNKGVFGIWGSFMIDQLFEDVPLGYLIRLEYLGKKKAQKSGREFKDYEIKARPNKV
jgi:hypothetical protein